MELLQVQVFFRHGSRTPLHYLPTNAVPEASWTSSMVTDLPHTVIPYTLIDLNSKNPVTFTPENKYPTTKLPGEVETGELTVIGQQDAFRLGQQIKNRYANSNKLISQNYDSSQIYCRSTFFERTVKSLRCVLAGMYRDEFEKNPEKSPIAIETDNIRSEQLYSNPKYSPVLSHFFADGVKEILQSQPHNEMKEKLRQTLNVKRLYDICEPRTEQYDCPVIFVRDDYIARKRAGFPIPPGLDRLLPEMSKLSVEELIWETLGKKNEWFQNVPIAIGYIFRLIMSNMKEQGKGHKCYLYCVHDSTVTLLLFGMGIFNGVWPPFMADISFELYRYKGGPHISKFVKTEIHHDIKSQYGPAANLPTPDPIDINHIRPVPGWTEDEFANLWFRVIYIGHPVPIQTMWNLHVEHDGYIDDTFLPVRLLAERVYDCLTV